MRLGGVPLSVAGAGGLIGGLCAGIALRGIGCEVKLYERTPDATASRGAGIVVQDDLRRLLQRHGAPELPTTSCLQRQREGPRIRSALGVEAEPFTRVAGLASLWLARPLGFDLPLSPLKGYSVTIPLTGEGSELP